MFNNYPYWRMIRIQNCFCIFIPAEFAWSTWAIETYRRPVGTAHLEQGLAAPGQVIAWYLASQLCWQSGEHHSFYLHIVQDRSQSKCAFLGLLLPSTKCDHSYFATFFSAGYLSINHNQPTLYPFPSDEKFPSRFTNPAVVQVSLLLERLQHFKLRQHLGLWEWSRWSWLNHHCGCWRRLRPRLHSCKRKMQLQIYFDFWLW